MGKLIDADEFLKMAIEERRFFIYTEDVFRQGYVVETIYKDLAEALDRMPEADPWKHGKWIVSKEDWVYSREVNVEVHVELEYECSVCGGKSEDKTNYCPHCGAKMDKEE